jgi:lysophospholipase L1-like esterase
MSKRNGIHVRIRSSYELTPKKVFLVVLISIVVIVEIQSIFILINSIISNDDISRRVIEYLKSAEFTGCENTCIEVTSDLELPYRLKPNCSIVFCGSDVRLNETIIEINSAGYRGELRSQSKDNTTKRILVLGDSFVFGYGLNITDTVPFLLEERLNELSEETIYDVINFGVPLYGLEDNINLLEDTGLSYDPDLIILFYLSNDLANNTRIIEIENYLKVNHKIPDEVDEELTDIYYSIYAMWNHDEEIASKTEEWIGNTVNSLLDRFNYMLESHGSGVLIFLWDESMGGDKVVEYAEANGWFVANSSSIRETYSQDLLIIHPEEPHPSSFFNTKVAELLHQDVKEIIDQD